MASEFASHSPYNYVFNNPLSFIDPDGRAPEWIDNGDGSYTAEAGDSAYTLSQQAGISAARANALVVSQHGQNYVGSDGGLKSSIQSGDVVSGIYSCGAQSCSNPAKFTPSGVIDHGDGNYTMPAGETPFTVTEIIWGGGGEIFEASYSEVTIEAGSQVPEQLRGKLSSGAGDTYGLGGGLPVEFLAATKGKMILDRSLTGRNLEEMFAPVSFVELTSMSAALKYTRLNGYNGTSDYLRDSGNKVFHANMFGAGAASAGASMSNYPVRFSQGN